VNLLNSAFLTLPCGKATAYIRHGDGDEANSFGQNQGKPHDASEQKRRDIQTPKPGDGNMGPAGES
jgi:hypothetical protein